MADMILAIGIGRFKFVQITLWEMYRYVTCNFATIKSN